jgi:hypothetical protein
MPAEAAKRPVRNAASGAVSGSGHRSANAPWNPPEAAVAGILPQPVTAPKPVAASRVFKAMEKLARLVLVVGVVLLLTAGALWMFG